MTPEGKVKAAVRKVLQEFGAYWFMPVQTGFGAQGVDFFCCVDGRFVAVETKRPGRVDDATPRQEMTLKAVRAAGGLAYVVDDASTLRAYLIRDLGGSSGSLLQRK